MPADVAGAILVWIVVAGCGVWTLASKAWNRR